MKVDFMTQIKARVDKKWEKDKQRLVEKYEDAELLERDMLVADSKVRAAEDRLRLMRDGDRRRRLLITRYKEHSVELALLMLVLWTKGIAEIKTLNDAMGMVGGVIDLY